MATKQHYVPNFVLRNFASADKTLWIMDKTTEKIWSKRGREEDRYDAFAENEYLPEDVDNAFWEPEEKAAQVVSTILGSARAGEPPCIDTGDKEHLCHFLLGQILRVPRVKRFSEDLHAGAYHTMLEDDPARDPDDEHPQREFYRRVLGPQVAIGGGEPGTATPLLVSDEPCYATETKVVMRIAKDTCLQLSQPAAFGGGYHRLHPDYVAALNRETWDNAHRFIAGPAREPIQHLAAGCT